MPEGPTVLKKKELVERVVAASGVKKKDAKSVVEATLRVLGDALAAGEDLVLPPFGKAKVNRQKDLGSGEMLVIKLRRNGPAAKPADGEDETLAAGGE
ncbi:MAG: HU family DNA-binding protein [Defluviimonas sp.]|nr:HU family DNA-binding protein [Defluviimonas sp.]